MFCGCRMRPEQLAWIAGFLSQAQQLLGHLLRLTHLALHLVRGTYPPGRT